MAGHIDGAMQIHRTLGTAIALRLDEQRQHDQPIAEHHMPHRTLGLAGQAALHGTQQLEAGGMPLTSDGASASSVICGALALRNT
jgi:hypothetical protein